jgi:hypothetical protein
VITQYIEALKLLKHATKRLKGCSKTSNFSAIYKIILVFKYLLSLLKLIALLYKYVNFNAYAKAPKDYFLINIRAT